MALCGVTSWFALSSKTQNKHRREAANLLSIKSSRIGGSARGVDRMTDFTFETSISGRGCSKRRRRREFNLSILAAAIVSFHISTMFTANAKQQQQEEEEELDRYADSEQGFTLLVPHSWIRVDKAGATVLFEEPNKSANNIGVVVNPVRLGTLQDFGTPEFVADKLIQAEKRKESTKDAEVIAVSERSGKGGLQVYEFEYKVDSTRGGLKRVFSAAFVASKKLYILNITNSDKPESPLDMSRRSILQQVVHSFDSADPMSS